MPVYACIAPNGSILLPGDPELMNVVHNGRGSYILEFNGAADVRFDVFVFSAKSSGPGCDAPRVVAAAVQDGPSRICMTISNLAASGPGEDAQFSYIRFRKVDEN